MERRVTDGGGELVIHFDRIQVNDITSASGVFVGTNTQWNWATHSKNNFGLGSVSGEENHVVSNINVIYDNDAIDTPISGGDFIVDR